MGKRVLKGLFVVPALMLALHSGTAQEAPEPAPESEKQAFKPGKFLTEGDYEHIRDALGYLNLTPEDLNFEKKHRDDRLRLKVCDRALDEPLAVPGMAEDAAAAFSVDSAVRPEFAATTLDSRMPHEIEFELPKDFVQAEERSLELGVELEKIRKDPQLGPNSKEYQKKSKQVDDAWEEICRLSVASVFGGDAKLVHPPQDEDVFATSVDTVTQMCRDLCGEAHAARAVAGKLTADELALLAHRMPALVAEQPISVVPVESKLEADEFDTAAKLPLGLVVGHDFSALPYLFQGYLTQIINDPEWASGTPSAVAGVTGRVIAVWEGPAGKWVIGGTGPNTYEGDDFIGIIDLGGDDTYKGRVACGIGLEGRAPISFVLDLSGDDRYLGEDFTQGFGFLGVGILHDLGGGNDVYKSRFCSQGCGLCGYGELYDDGGDDTYTSDSGAQGAGVFGYGHLIDRAGNDVYRGCRFVQGFAQVMGVGVLTDGDGNDLYYAGGKYLHEPLFNDRYQSLSQGFAIGNRYGETGGGVGMLLDEGDGNDVYQADIYGQGSSYWYSLGMLVDEGGNDTYTLGQYGQGGGIHLSAGILVDLKGNDSYTNPYGVGLGGAHDWAVGWLIDRAGDDLYQGNGQGQGLNFAVGILMDCAGNDSHSTNHANSIGRGTNNDISLLLDFEGTDVYGPEEVKDGQFTKRGKHAMVYDVPKGWFPGIDTSTLPTKQVPPPTKVIVQHILISWKGKNERVTLKDPYRTEAQAEALRDELLRKARKKGADWAGLQKTHNEDSDPGAAYTVEPDSPFVKPFKELALSLGAGQIDWCESSYGYHIIKRIE